MTSRSIFVQALCMCAFAISLTFSGTSYGQAISPAGVTVRETELGKSLSKDVLHAIRIGVGWLEQSQQEEGCWSNPAFPAVTALAVSAALNSPDVLNSATRPDFVSRGLDFILSCVQEDGGIYQPIEGLKGGGLPNYNTAGNPEYADTIARGRKFLIGGQHRGEDVFSGGMGYDKDTDRPYADLSNTVFALEALRQTEPLETPGGEDTALDWNAAIEFVSRCQHLRKHNDAEWVSEAPDQYGGFVYHPKKSQAGAVESGDAEENYLRSYGSMTYAGLLSFIYAGVDRNDERVQAAVQWLSRRWTLEENPGIGTDGLYYSYHVMAKALNAYGKDTLILADGSKVNWRPQLVQKVVSLQRIDPATGLGNWQNENNRWWENDPNLSTSYTVLALEMAALAYPKLDMIER